MANPNRFTPPPFSGLARPLDPRYPSNLAIMVATVGVGALSLAYGLAQNTPPLESLWTAIHWAGAVLAAWILARELDPDHVLTSAFAPPLALLAVFLLDQPIDITTLGIAVISVRAVNRTSGLMIQTVDIPFFMILAGLAGLGQFWLAGFILVAAFLWDAVLPKPHPYFLPIAGALTLLTVGVALVTGRFKLAPEGEVWLILPALAALGWYSLVRGWQPAQVQSVGDVTGVPLDPQRVQAGQLLLILGWSVVVIWQGADGLAASSALGAAIFSFLAYQTYRATQ